MRIFRILFVTLAVGIAALAADVSGKWKTSFTTPDGQVRENTLALQQDGEKLTGTLASRIGDAKIQDGVVKGDELSFTVIRNFGGEDVKFTYKGKVTGNKMALKVSAGDREFEMTATKE
jgi:hypothetical protein